MSVCGPEGFVIGPDVEDAVSGWDSLLQPVHLVQKVSISVTLLSPGNCFSFSK